MKWLSKSFLKQWEKNFRSRLNQSWIQNWLIKCSYVCVMCVHALFSLTSKVNITRICIVIWPWCTTFDAVCGCVGPIISFSDKKATNSNDFKVKKTCTRWKMPASAFNSRYVQRCTQQFFRKNKKKKKILICTRKTLSSNLTIFP